MHKIKIKFNLCKFLKRQINDFKQAKYLKLGLIVFVFSGLFSYFIVQNHIYAFDNEALITRELNAAKGPEVTDPVKKREIMKYAINFPKEGKWQSNNNLTIIKNGKAIQSQSMRAYSFPIVFNFLEKPRTKLCGRRIDHKLDKTYKQDQYYLDAMTNDGESKDDFVKYPPDIDPEDNSYFEYHTPGEWIYGHISSTFYRMNFKRMNINSKQMQFNVKMRTSNVFGDTDWYYPFPIKHIHIYQSKQNSNIYLANFDFYVKDFRLRHLCSMSELINIKTKRILIGKYNMIFPTAVPRFYWATYTYDFLGDKWI